MRKFILRGGITSEFLSKMEPLHRSREADEDSQVKVETTSGERSKQEVEIIMIIELAKTEAQKRKARIGAK